jgi:hypothetical protein
VFLPNDLVEVPRPKPGRERGLPCQPIFGSSGEQVLGHEPRLPVVLV